MDFTTFCFALQGVGLTLLFCIVGFQRLLWKHGQRRGKKQRRFYPTNYTMGNSFQQLQLFVAPNTEYTIEEKLKEDVEEDDEGGPDHPEKHLERQLRRIRRGEQIDMLTTIVREDKTAIG